MDGDGEEETEVAEVPRGKGGDGGREGSVVVHGIAGVSAGALSTLLLYPVDSVKTRLQAHQSPYRNVVGALKGIVGGEGVRALYQGLSAALVGATASWGLYFLAYNAAKNRRWKKRQEGDGGYEYEGRLSPLDHTLCGVQAGLFTSLLTQPIWLVKTRMQLQRKSQGAEVYNSLLDGFKKILRRDGVTGLYTGWVPALLLVSHGALQFMAYEELKYFFQRFHPPGEPLSSVEVFICGGISKLFATICTYPYNVIKTRIQDQQNLLERTYTSTLGSMQLIWRKEGFRGFYRGFGANILRVAPQTAITFVVYEYVTKKLKKEQYEQSNSV